MEEAQRRQLLFGSSTMAHRRGAAPPPLSADGSTAAAASASASASASAGTSSSAPANEQETIEAENDNKVDHLRGRVGEMRHLALDIGNEVREQNAMLDGMAGSFDQVGDSVRRSIALVTRLAGTGGGMHVCALFCFAFLFFALVYLLLR